MRVVLLRHGETEWNSQGRLQGRANSSLTRRGCEQARAIGAWLRSIEVVRIRASPSERVKETLRIAGNDMYLGSTFHEELQELDFGRYTGRRKDQIPTEFSLRREGDRWNTRFPDGESLADVSGRTESFLSQHDIWHKDTLCVVAHETVNATLIGHLLKLGTAMTAEIKQPQGVGYVMRDWRFTVHLISSCELANVCFVRTRRAA